MLSRALRRAAQRLGRRSLHVKANTLVNPTPEAVEAWLSGVKSDSVLLYSLSANLAGWQRYLPLVQGHESVGSFHHSTHPSVSLAAFERSNPSEASTFYTPLSGRGHAEVGRWQRIGTDWGADKSGSEMGSLEALLAEKGWNGVWDGSSVAQRGASGTSPFSNGGEQEKVEHEGDGLNVDATTCAVVCLTDANPGPVLSRLQKRLIRTVGLVSAPTPFVTGSTHTLFRNGEKFETGTVGVQLRSRPQIAVRYGTIDLGAPMMVDKSRGNLLLSFKGESPNPTQTLIRILQERDKGKARTGLEKDEDFWLAISDPHSDSVRVVRILSGDPSRGAISLDTEIPLSEGQMVQFQQRDPHRSAEPQAPLQSDELRFGGLLKKDTYEAPPASSGEMETTGFLACSEEGFVLGRDVCTVPGADVTCSW